MKKKCSPLPSPWVGIGILQGRAGAKILALQDAESDEHSNRGADLVVTSMILLYRALNVFICLSSVNCNTCKECSTALRDGSCADSYCVDPDFADEVRIAHFYSHHCSINPSSGHFLRSYWQFAGQVLVSRGSAQLEHIRSSAPFRSVKWKDP
jgi:hypothetical protein